MKGIRRILIPAVAVGSIFASAAHGIPYRHHWECVPFAREMSGIQIYGKYDRGRQPRVGAVLAFKPHGSMQLGHVAMVSKIVDDRTVKLTHANWSLINGRRGQIERNVTAIDVSEAGDWSRVKVWFAPLQDLGKTSWPTHGFIYPGADDSEGKSFSPAVELPEVRYANAKPTGRLDGLEKFLKKVREKN
jgi:hypothetical protein